MLVPVLSGNRNNVAGNYPPRLSTIGSSNEVVSRVSTLWSNLINMASLLAPWSSISWSLWLHSVWTGLWQEAEAELLLSSPAFYLSLFISLFNLTNTTWSSSSCFCSPKITMSQCRCGSVELFFFSSCNSYRKFILSSSFSFSNYFTVFIPDNSPCNLPLSPWRFKLVALSYKISLSFISIY